MTPKKVKRKVTTPEVFFELARTSQLGNTLKCWRNLSSLNLDPTPYSGFVWPFPLRRTHHNQGTLKLEVKNNIIYDLPSQELPEHYFLQELPNSFRHFQGHLYFDHDKQTLALDYDDSQSQISLRRARHQFQTLHGISAIHKLKQWITRPDEVDMLLDVYYTYDHPTIEFTLWSKPCGILNKKLAFWEVRNY